MVSHGNSAALVIDKPILELLKVDMDTPLEIATDGRNLIISPVESTKREKRFTGEREIYNMKIFAVMQIYERDAKDYKWA